MQTGYYHPNIHSFGHKYGMKMFYIGIITVVLIIASSTIWLMAYDREQTSEEVNREVTDHWGQNLMIYAPVIYGSDIEIFPDTIDFVAKLENEQLSRNIYTTNVYTATVTVSGTFDVPDLNTDSLKSSLSLLAGYGKILECNALTFGNKTYPVEIRENELSANLDYQLPSKRIPFALTFKIRGSESIKFRPFTDKNTIRVTGNCPMPSFRGEELPVERTVSDSGFTAKWVNIDTSLPSEYDPEDYAAYNMSVGNVYVDDIEYHDGLTLDDNPGDCGVEFVTGVDSYRKVVRAIKFAYLIILLTFIAVFATELLSRRNVPLLNYFLIGAALVVFYTLLLSMAELIGFGLGYLIAAIMTVGLITLYLRTSVGSSRLAAFNGLFLSIIYGCCYVMICLGQFALLIGSLMIFLAIAGSMFVSLRINRR